MKKTKLIHLLLLLMFSLTAVHDFVFEAIDEHTHNAKEYIGEFSYASSHTHAGGFDVCDLHYELHMPYILLEPELKITSNLVLDTPLFQQENYKFHYNIHFFKPPIA